MRYEYQYITLGTGGGYINDNSRCGHRAIIDEQAAQGWRYVGCVPTSFTSHGGTAGVDLIFERPAEEIR